MFPLLDTIDDPAAFARLDGLQLHALAAEIRGFLVEKVTHTGGHLGPNLGVVELTIALHRVFDSPNDMLLFDTGHQAYVHKLLTGRRAGFDRLGPQRQRPLLCAHRRRTGSAPHPPARATADDTTDDNQPHHTGQCLPEPGIGVPRPDRRSRHRRDGGRTTLRGFPAPTGSRALRHPQGPQRPPSGGRPHRPR
jgi:hypothetical protein